MELDGYIAQVQSQLSAAASLGDDRTRETAQALATAAAPAIRLALLAAMSAVADEVTGALLDTPSAPAVSVRLDGDDLQVEVRTATPEPAAPAPPEDGDSAARISLRLSETLKTDIEDAARRESISVNSWLVRAASTALSPSWGPWGPGLRGGDPRRQGGNRGNNSHHITGWING
jgi:hypothetical protein